MSGILMLFLLLGLVATILYAAGYSVGVKQAFDDAQEEDEITDYKDSAYSVTIAIAVLASAVIIGLVGVNPIFIYAGPLLAIVTTFMVGYAFFYERNMRKSDNQ